MLQLPFVSIIVPCHNDQATIRLLLEGVYRQTYPRGRIELVLVEGMSTDRTRDEIAAYLCESPDFKVKVVDKFRRDIPAGLNRAIAQATGELLIRSDAHSVPYPDYEERNVAALRENQGEIVGGIWDVNPGATHWVARAIAAAGAHLLGVGDALYRYTRWAQYVDTVPFGAFRKDLIDHFSMSNGPFDETLLTNEDYEFYVRVRRSGGRIWLDPAIRSVYFARTSLVSLAKQYWRYGYWKLCMLLHHPQAIRWRQALPPLFVLFLVGLGILGLRIPLAYWLLFFEVISYISILLVSGAQKAIKRNDPCMVIGIPLAIGTMHVSWGSAFIWSLACQIVRSFHKEDIFIILPH